MCGSDLSGEVPVHGDYKVQLCEDLPENLLVHLAALPVIEVSGGAGVEGHVTDHQGTASG